MTRSEDWRPLAQKLTDDLEQKNVGTERIRAAFAQVPRHVFVPAHYKPTVEEGRVDWRTVDNSDPEWLETVYSDDVLVTQLSPVWGQPDDVVRPTSSSTLPSLMADMLAQLGVEPGMRVLEIGTGTGYNAAILCHLLGDANVTTIDIDPALVDQAEQRLSALGYRPSFEPQKGTYDRILATHAVEAIPYQWIHWAKPGARILTDLRSTRLTSGLLTAGAWAELTVDPLDSAKGRLFPARGGFMGTRTQPAYADDTPLPVLDERETFHRDTGIAPGELADPRFGLYLWWQQPQLRALGDDRTLTLIDPHGRWARYDAPDQITYGLPGDLWVDLQEAMDDWDEMGRPGIDQWAITVDEAGRTELDINVY